MKMKLNSPSRLALVAATAAGLVLGGNAFGQATKVEEGPPKGTSSMAGVGQKPRKSDQTPTPAPGAKSGAATAPLSAQDKNFMMSAAKGGAMEVHMGEMAAKQGQSAEVKKLGSEMAAAHTKAKADAKVDRVAADTTAKSTEKTAEARKDAAVDKRDADYKVAIEKCDSLSGAAKDTCVKNAKTRYGKT